MMKNTFFKTNGFSLIEILIASFISSIILIVLFLVLNSTLKFFDTNSQTQNFINLKETLGVLLNSRKAQSKVSITSQKVKFNAFVKEENLVFFEEIILESQKTENSCFLILKKRRKNIDTKFQKLVLLKCDNLSFKKETLKNSTIYYHLILNIVKNKKTFKVLIPIYEF